MEAGQVIPQLDETVRMAGVLHIPIQYLLTGKNRPSVGLKGIAHELHNLGIRDLIVSDAEVPGAFRRPEQVIAVALRGDRPEVRILEAMPYLLAKNRLQPKLAMAYGDLYDPRLRFRLAWLADVTLTLARREVVAISPEQQRPLERLTKIVKKPSSPDDLGLPGDGAKSPIWRRWNISYGGTLREFELRSKELSRSRDDRGFE